MNKKSFLALGIVVVALLGICVLISVFTNTQNPPASISITTLPPSGSVPASSSTCSSDTSKLTDVPQLPSNLNWSEIASSTRSDVFGFDSYRNGIRFSGNSWIATSTASSLWDSYGNYVQTLVKDGWLPQADVATHKLVSLAADGPISSSQGRVKIQNDNMRVVWIFEKSKSITPATLEIFVSDIVPISQIIPDYKSNCQESTSTPN